IAAAAEIVHAAGGLLHVDAVQTAGRILCDMKALGADLVTVSGHKLGGPQGVGALVKASEALHLADPLIRGGGQERGSRAGTENVAAIVGFGAAAEEARNGMAADSARIAGLRERLEAGLRAISAEKPSKATSKGSLSLGVNWFHAYLVGRSPALRPELHQTMRVFFETRLNT